LPEEGLLARGGLLPSMDDKPAAFISLTQSFPNAGSLSRLDGEASCLSAMGEHKPYARRRVYLYNALQKRVFWLRNILALMWEGPVPLVSEA
jgi:hypothetical protein